MTYDDGMARLLHGDALDVMPLLPEQSVDCVATSPPFWGLRLYAGQQERVWGGIEKECLHEWGEERIVKRGHPGSLSTMQGTQTANLSKEAGILGQFCQRCGAWRGSFGNEPNVALYIAHLMEFMRAIKRVLKDTGVAYVNLGDSYANDSRGGIRPPSKGSIIKDARYDGSVSISQSELLPALNLAGVPQRFFLACQEQGWIVRSEIILAKDSPMPESLSGWRWQRCRVKVGKSQQGDKFRNSGRYVDQEALADNSTADSEPWIANEYEPCPGCEKCEKNGGLVLRKGSWRPTSSHEKLFMLTKGDGYFSDGEDVREGLSPATLADKRNNSGRHTYASSKWDQMEGNKPSWYRAKTFVNPETGRNLRDVWPMKSSAFTMQLCKSCKRVYTGAQFGRLSGETKRCSCGASEWLSHFAAYNVSLPTTCILASTSPRGNCSKCGLPWVRVIERENMIINRSDWAEKSGNRTASSGTMVSPPKSQTLDWKPSCSCGAPSEPAIVLDPFNGTASTGIAAKRLGRRYIGIDLSEDYLLLSAARLAAETAGLI